MSDGTYGLDPWQNLVAINFPVPPSADDATMAVWLSSGPGGAGVAGDSVATAAPVKIGSATQYPATLVVLASISFQIPSNDDGSRPVTPGWGDLNLYHQIFFNPATGRDEYIYGDALWAARLAAIPAGLSITQEIVSVSATNFDGGTTDGTWGLEFIGIGLSAPATIDLTQSGGVVRLDPAPPTGQPEPPTTTWIQFSIASSYGAGGPSGPEIITNTVSVTGYAAAAPTKDNPNPPAMTFADNGDGTIKVSGGVLKWSTSETAPNCAPPPPVTQPQYKFNRKGPL
jgi:hypothetical protein